MNQSYNVYVVLEAEQVLLTDSARWIKMPM